MNTRRKQTGFSLVELMVALAIGSFLMIGAVKIHTQSRQAFLVNESIARIQETAQFAMDTIEADLRMASNWGRNSRGLAVEGRSLSGDENPNNLPQPARNCAADWVLNLALPVDGMNNVYELDCPATGGAQANSDVITIRRGSALPVDAATEGDGRLMIQSSRVQGEIFEGNAIPDSFSAADSSTHSLVISSYYVSSSSNLVEGVPTLRRHRLVGGGAAGPRIVDEEVFPGVENLQIQLGIDVNQDNSVDRYVNPGDAIYDPGAVGYVPGARVLTARIWLLVRGINIEPGIQNNHAFDPGDVKLSVQNDSFRRMQISKTILLRNART